MPSVSNVGGGVMGRLEALGRLAFEPPKLEKQLTREQRDDSAAVRTYRYLRLGMIVIVSAMLASIVLTAREAGCFQNSISAYYYTPTGPIFVAGLTSVGVSLIVIKGSTWLEDVMLMLAGALAPIVVFVPTSVEDACNVRSSLVQPAQPSTSAQLNNLKALLVAGAVAWILGLIVLVAEREGMSRGSFRRRTALLVILAIGLAVAAAMVSSESLLRQHGWSAVAMFGILALVSIYDGARLVYLNRRDDKRTSRFWWGLASAYVVVGVAMIGAGIIQLTIDQEDWRHKTLVVEMIEIGLFAVIWTIQSIERWGRILDAQPRPTAESPAVDPRPQPV